MSIALGLLITVVFPFLFILVIIGLILAVKQVKLVFRLRSAFARLFLWLERSGLFEREDDREQREISA
jgi:hypothetical protein